MSLAPPTAAGPEEQLAWEARAGRVAALAAVPAGVLFIVTSILLGRARSSQARDPSRLLVTIARESGSLILAGALAGLAALLVGVVLVYLYRATKYRRRELPVAALSLAIGGALLAAAIAVAQQVVLSHIAHGFVSHGPQTAARARGVLTGGALQVIGGLGLAGSLALGFAVFLINLNAMRAGLLGRGMAVLGFAVAIFFVVPIRFLLVFELVWFVSLALIFVGRFPGGRGPAWESGEAIPWPSAAERREELERQREEEAAGGGEGDGRPGAGPSDRAAAGGADGSGAGSAAPARRKRKRGR